MPVTPPVDVDVVAEPSTGTYGVRTGVQGVSWSAVLYLANKWGWVHLDAEDVLVLAPLVSAATTVVWRLVENRVGKGLLRNV